MRTITHTEFMKKVFKKGKFKQFIVSPYASEEKHMQSILLFSDKVEEPTYQTYRKKKMALILPYNNDLRISVKKYIKAIYSHTGVQASYFGLFDLFTEKMVEIV